MEDDLRPTTPDSWKLCVFTHPFSFAERSGSYLRTFPMVEMASKLFSEVLVFSSTYTPPYEETVHRRGNITIISRKMKWEFRSARQMFPRIRCRGFGPWLAQEIRYLQEKKARAAWRLREGIGYAVRFPVNLYRAHRDGRHRKLYIPADVLGFILSGRCLVQLEGPHFYPALRLLERETGREIPYILNQHNVYWEFSTYGAGGLKSRLYTTEVGFSAIVTALNDFGITSCRQINVHVSSIII